MCFWRQLLQSGKYLSYVFQSLDRNQFQSEIACLVFGESTISWPVRIFKYQCNSFRNSFTDSSRRSIILPMLGHSLHSRDPNIHVCIRYFCTALIWPKCVSSNKTLCDQGVCCLYAADAENLSWAQKILLYISFIWINNILYLSYVCVKEDS
jgi:hypothetical protein